MKAKVLCLCLDMDFSDAPWDKHTGAGHLYVKECIDILKNKNIETLVICRWNAKEKPEIESFWSVILHRIQVWEKEQVDKEELLNQESLINEEINKILKKNNFEPTLIHAFYWYSWRAALPLAKKYPWSHFLYSIISLGKVKHLWSSFLSHHDKIREETEKEIFEEASCILAVSLQEKENAIKLYNVLPKKIVVVGRWVDINLFKPYVWEQKDSLLFVGRLVKSKGYERILKVYEKLLMQYTDKIPRLIFIWWTEDEVNDVKLSITSPFLRNALKDEKIIWLWKIPRNELVGYYNKAYLTIVASYYEPWARVILESMACATPVIMTPTGYAKELVKHRNNGYIVPLGNLGMWVQLIYKHLYNKKQEQIASNARTAVLQFYSMEVFNQKQWDIYNFFIFGK